MGITKIVKTHEAISNKGKKKKKDPTSTPPLVVGDACYISQSDIVS